MAALVPIVSIGASRQSYAYDNTSLSGMITCSSTVVVNSNAIASGQIALVADGTGQWTGGSASYQRADGATCNYLLAWGEYSVGDDGSGESVTRWHVDPTSSSGNCAPVIPRSVSEISLADGTFSSSHGHSRSESGTCAFSQ